MSKYSVLQKRVLGQTSLEIPILGVGGAAYMYGDSGKRTFAERSFNGFRFPTDKESYETLQTAWDLGVRFYDTAPLYGRGQSEHRLGRFLYDIEDPNSFVLNTKVGRVLKRPYVTRKLHHGTQGSHAHSPPGQLRFDHVHDYSYGGVMRSFEDSMQRLGLSEIDCLAIHDLDRMHFGEELVRCHLQALATGGIRALEELKGNGHVRAIGAGVNGVGDITRFLQHVDLDYFIVSQIFTLLHHRAPVSEYCDWTIEGGALEEFDLAHSRGASIIGCTVFNAGILVQDPKPGVVCNYRPATAEELERVMSLRKTCERHQVALPAAAIQFPLRHPAVSAILVGFGNKMEAEHSIHWLETSISDDFWSDLGQRDLIHASMSERLYQ